MNLVNTYKEKEHMWILSQVASTTQYQDYTDFNENMHNDKDETAHIEFINRIYNKTNNENGAFEIRGIDMHDFCNHYYTSYVKVSDQDLYLISMNKANILINKLFGDDDNLTHLTSLGVYMILQRYDNNEMKVEISKQQFYDLIITSLCNFSKKLKDQISPDRLKILSIIKNGLFDYLGLTSRDFDLFMKEVIIENANNKRNIDVPTLIDDLMQHKKVSNNNLDEDDLQKKFVQLLIFLKNKWSSEFKLNDDEKNELSECLKGKKNYEHKKITFVVFSVVRRNYILRKEDWGNDESTSLFDAYEQNENHMFSDADISMKSKLSRGGEYWSIDYFVQNQLYFHSLLNDYVVDHVLKIWAHLFNKHSPSILCMNSKVPNLFITQDNVSIQTTITSLSRLTNGKFFKGINMFLVPICDKLHYYLVVINFTKNEGYVIDGLNCDQAYEEEKRTYMLRALALVLICQQLKIPNLDFNVPTSFNIDTFKLKSCFIPQQRDTKSCGVIVMMAIYQIYIQGRNINSLYNEMNHKTFRKLFFDTIYSTINLFIQQPDNVSSSKKKQASEYQDGNKVKDIRKPDDILSSKNIQVDKDEIKNSIESQLSEKQMNTTTNQAPDNINDKKIDGNVSDTKTSDKSNQNTNELQDASNKTNENSLGPKCSSLY